MTDKELLETIKDQFEWGEENLESGIYNLESEEIKWLIEQAEKVEQLEQEIEDLKLQKRPTYVTIEGTAEDVHKDLKKFIIENDELKQEIEHLKEQLKRAQSIINLFKSAFITGDAAHLTINGRSVQAMALIEELEGES
jgi:uncharacterized protein YPO0396